MLIVILGSSSAYALSITLDGTRTVISGTDCGIATYRFGTTASWQGTPLDLIVEVNSEDNEYAAGNCVYVSGGILSVNLRDGGGGDNVSFIDATLTVVAQGTTSAINIDRITGTGFDLDHNGVAAPGIYSTGTDDIYISGPGASYLSSSTNVSYSTGTFPGGNDVKFQGQGASLGNCDDTPGTPVITCRAAASWTGGSGINSISEINVRFQNDNAYGYIPATDPNYPTAYRLLQLSLVDSHAEEIMAPNSDYGDAPISYGSANHTLLSLSTILGNGLAPDHENSHQSSTNALGDDSNGTPGTPFYDDEDAVRRNGTLLDGQNVAASENVSIDVTTFGTGYLSAWMDLDISGDFAQAGEKLLSDVFINSSTVQNTSLVLPVPYTATGGNTYLRFRFSTTAGATYSGSAGPGEVEDYRIIVDPMSPAYNMVKTSDGPITAAGPLTYTFTFTNTGNVVLSNLNISDPDIDLGSLTNCPIASLAVGASASCTAIRTISQSAVDAGTTISNTATPSADDPVGDPVVETDIADNTVLTAVTQTPSYTMAKTSDTATMSAPGSITYTFEFVNTGNTTLTNLTVADSDIDSGSLTVCPISSLAVGATVSCTATRAISQAQIDAGPDIVNTAVPSATSSDGVTVVAEDDTANDNSTSTDTLQSPIATNDSQANPGFPSPSNTTTLATIASNDSDPDGTIDVATVDLDPSTSGIQTTLTNSDGTYTVDGLGNVIFAPNVSLSTNPTPIPYTVNDNDGLTSNTATLTVTYSVSADISVTKTLITAGPYTTGQTLTYEVVVTNSASSAGAATNIVVTDLVTNLAISSVSSTNCSSLPCTIPSLAVGASETITVQATAP